VGKRCMGILCQGECAGVKRGKLGFERCFASLTESSSITER
jgi:hypothetical protein